MPFGSVSSLSDANSFVFFGDTLDAVAWIIGVSLRGWNEVANLIGTRDG